MYRVVSEGSNEVVRLVPCVYCVSGKPLFNRQALCCIARMIVGTPMRLRKGPLESVRDSLTKEQWQEFKRYYERLRDEHTSTHDKASTPMQLPGMRATGV